MNECPFVSVDDTCWRPAVATLQTHDGHVPDGASECLVLFVALCQWHLCRFPQLPTITLERLRLHASLGPDSSNTSTCDSKWAPGDPDAPPGLQLAFAGCGWLLSTDTTTMEGDERARCTRWLRGAASELATIPACATTWVAAGPRVAVHDRAACAWASEAVPAHMRARETLPGPDASPGRWTLPAVSDPHEAHGVGALIKALVQQHAGASLILRAVVCLVALVCFAHSALVLGGASVV